MAGDRVNVTRWWMFLGEEMAFKWEGLTIVVDKTKSEEEGPVLVGWS